MMAQVQDGALKAEAHTTAPGDAAAGAAPAGTAKGVVVGLAELQPAVGQDTASLVTRAEEAEFGVRGCFLANICPNCGKRLGLIFGISGFGLMQQSHFRRCTARQPETLQPEQRPSVTSTRSSPVALLQDAASTFREQVVKASADTNGAQTEAEAAISTAEQVQHCEVVQDTAVAEEPAVDKETAQAAEAAASQAQSDDTAVTEELVIETTTVVEDEVSKAETAMNAAVEQVQRELAQESLVEAATEALEQKVAQAKAAIGTAAEQDPSEVAQDTAVAEEPAVDKETVTTKAKAQAKAEENTVSVQRVTEATVSESLNLAQDVVAATADEVAQEPSNSPAAKPKNRKKGGKK